VFLANLYAGLPLAWLAARTGERAEAASRSLMRILLSVSVPLTVAVLPPLASLGAETAADGNPSKTETIPCELGPAVATLQEIWKGRPPQLIGADIDLGPTLLLLTPHKVLGAPYHRNTGGLVDVHRLLYSDETSAAEVARRRGVGMILLCPPNRPARDAEARQFKRQLLSGKVPPWLRKLPSTGEATVFLVERYHLAEP
jgi:hypothetical protein